MSYSLLLVDIPSSTINNIINNNTAQQVHNEYASYFFLILIQALYLFNNFYVYKKVKRNSNKNFY